eukprot:CAMPEP_0197708968 /NCGR_PEP_ID=MMETSP1338-20131121/128221_1 /TAXON_ID=43686 ORGANISM="Pelagodinium beii, Strain RCC1491" /NCGR_SAMPLE_ID=MMETSP1338 /ASSEMBLY_ACC=CAM_ASM_000754 /LENGTH=235 /DNA_ID=CAMNT_0043292901 /DNA_START=62 /DNA_END=769 /DNA_ORIENTATION=+
MGQPFKDTIEITDGVFAYTHRGELKRTLEQFGAIDICHKMGDPRDDPVWVRYQYSADAEKALEAIGKGEVALGGVPLKASWKTKNENAPGRLDRAQGIMKEGHTSRDLYLAMQKKKQGGGGGSRDVRDDDRRQDDRGGDRRGVRRRQDDRDDRDNDDRRDDRRGGRDVDSRDDFQDDRDDRDNDDRRDDRRGGRDVDSRDDFDDRRDDRRGGRDDRRQDDDRDHDDRRGRGRRER